MNYNPSILSCQSEPRLIGSIVNKVIGVEMYYGSFQPELSRKNLRANRSFDKELDLLKLPV